MKHTLTKTSDTSVSVVVTVDEAEFTKAKDFAVSRLSRDVKVQGFRKGKVPSKVAEKNIDPNVLASESVEYAVNAALNDIIATEDLRVLDQDQVWVDRAGLVVPINSMSENYVRGLITFLQRHAIRLHHAAMSDALNAVLPGIENGHLDVDAVNALLDQPADPETWLRDTPLIQGLLKLPL